MILVWLFQNDEFTHSCSAEQFVAHLLIYPGFTGMVSSVYHFPVEPEYEDYLCLDQAVSDFEEGLDSILTDYIETPEWDTSFDKPDTIVSVSSEFLC